MVCMVDVRLRGNTILLVEKILEEEYQQKWQDSGKEKIVKDAVLNKMKLFYSVIVDTVKERLGRYSALELKDLSLMTEDFLAEGHGSIEICEPPTEAQSRIVRSLIKVIFHQLTLKSLTEAINEVHSNLILSLFIKKITCDIFVETNAVCRYRETRTCSLKDKIAKILTECDTEVLEEAHEQQRERNEVGKYDVHLFCCLEDLEALNENRSLVDDFDKIDLYDEASISDKELDDSATLTSISGKKQWGGELQVSKQTLSLAKFTFLPSTELENLWESLYFDNHVKQKMYSYATIALKMALLSGGTHGNQESPAFFSSNKMLIVHGPPGTGKTTICKALGQKLSIRTGTCAEVNPVDRRYKGLLIEISCARIFSRWFGESSKNLTSVFTDVENLLKVNEKANRFVCLLIDEVEAIAFSRSDLLNKNESTDGVRVVSTLLTQLDRLKKYNNLLVVATSNLLESLDPAFIDRADGLFYIGNPSRLGTIQIITIGLKELMTRKAIYCNDEDPDILSNQTYKDIIDLIATKCLCLDLSGRNLRKLPLICLSENFRVLPVRLNEFLLAFALSVADIGRANHV